MERHVARHLEILTAIGEGAPLTQRALAERMGVALGLTNLYLKRLATKGYIKVAGFGTKPAVRKRMRYLLTAKGLAEKTRLTYEYMSRSVTQYRLARAALRAALAHVPAQGWKRIALYGDGEAAELAYLTLKEFGLEPIGVYVAAPRGTFLGLPVRSLHELPPEEELDAVIVATFDKPKVHVPALTALGIPAAKLLTLYPARTSNGSH